MFIYQWGPPTLLGFAVFGSGLVLAALNPGPAGVPAGEPAPVAADPLPARPSPHPYRPPALPKPEIT